MSSSELFGTVDDRIVTYIRASIVDRGGTGRRLGRIQMEMAGPYVEDDEFRAAVQRLVAGGRIRLDEAFPGMVYAILEGEAK